MLPRCSRSFKLRLQIEMFILRVTSSMRVTSSLNEVMIAEYGFPDISMCSHECSSYMCTCTNFRILRSVLIEVTNAKSLFKHGAFPQPLQRWAQL